MPDAKKQGRSNKAMTFFVCFLAALAGLLFGLDIGVIAGALPFIADEFQITSHTQEWVVSSMMFGAAVGAVGSGWLSFKLGRKKSLMIGAILFVAGSLFSAAAPNVEVLILSRVLLGLAVGVASYTAPLYLSEIAPEKIRGSMISMAMRCQFPSCSSAGMKGKHGNTSGSSAILFHWSPLPWLRLGRLKTARSHAEFLIMA